MIEPIKIVIHDFPKMFPVVIKSFINSVSSLKAKSSCFFGSEIKIINFARLKSFVGLKAKNETDVLSQNNIKCRIATAAKSKSTHATLDDIEAFSTFSSSGISKIKSYSKLNAIVAIFLKWRDRKDETWNEVKDLTNKQFVLREIK